MTLKEIFENKEFKKYQHKELDKSDKEYFLERLKTGKRIYDVLPYLSVVSEAPIEFLKPIIEEAMEYEDISIPKRWMETINKLYTPKKVQEIILNRIKTNKNFRIKCRAVAILYFVGGVISKSERKKFYEQRIKVLSKEFIASNNIVFKYFLIRHLPKEIEKYPFEIRETAKVIVDEIYNNSFPHWTNPLIERIKGNPELEKLLFEDLNWRKE